MSIVSKLTTPVISYLFAIPSKVAGRFANWITPPDFYPSENRLKAIAEWNKELAVQIRVAIRTGAADCLAEILKDLPWDVSVALVNQANETGDTPLDLIVSSGSIQCMDLLLDAGAVPRGHFIHKLIEKKKTKILENLLPKLSGLNRALLINAVDAKGRSPLLLCAALGASKSMALLLEAGANPSYVNPEGENFLHVALLQKQRKTFGSFIKKTSKEVAKKLANATNAKGESPLFCCRFQGALPCMNLLLDAGANLLQTDSSKNTFLHCAAEHGCPALIKGFLERLSKDTTLSQEARDQLLNATNKDGNTPLMGSALFGRKKCLEHLLNAGADPFIPNQQGDFVYTAAILNDRTSIAQILAEREPKLKGTYTLLRLANAFGLEPKALIAGKKTASPASNNCTEQNHVLATLKEVAIREKIFSHYNEEQYEELLDAFTTAADSFPIREIVQKIRQGKLVIVPAGWHDHSIALVFRDGYLVICNRGEGCDDEHGVDRTFFAHKISLEQVTEELLERCLDKNDSPAKEAMKLFYGELLQTLNAKQDAFCKKIQTISPKPIYADICAFATAKAELRVALALLTKDTEMARDTSKAWATKQREWALDMFRKTPSPFDQVFLEEIIAAQVQRLEQRKKTLLVKHLYHLKEATMQKQPLASKLQDFGNFCGVTQRKKLEECLRIVYQKKKMKVSSHLQKVSFPLFGRKMFIHRKFSSALKQEAIDMFIEQIDPDKSIRMKIES